MGLRRRPGTRHSAALLLAGVLVLSGCSADGDPSATSSPTDGAPSASPSVAETSPAALGAAAQLDLPPGVELTPGSTELELGEEATIAWQPRNGVVGVLDITVQRIREVTWKAFEGWKLSAKTRKMTPYFVDVMVANAGAVGLGGVPVPLYLRATNGTLVQVSEFKGNFKPCPSRPLPKKFGPGKEIGTCLVYLAPPGESAEAVVFRPTEDHLPISWSGDIVEPGEKKQGKQRKPQRKQQQKKKQQQQKDAGEE